MNCEVFDAASGAAAWRRRLEAVPGAGDVYFTPEYVALHEGRARLFCFGEGRRSWLYAFVQRSIPGESLCDLETPNGYGGPMCADGDPGFLAEAHAAFDDWCRSERVVAEFTRFHPLLANERWAHPRVAVIDDRRTASLALPAAEPSKEVRYLLRKGREAGISIIEQPAASVVERFAEFYRDAMRRMNAPPEYSFGAGYFEGLARLVQRSGWILAAVSGGEWVAAAVFLKGESMLHYHLSVSSATRLPGAVNLLIDEGARHGAAAGLRRLHLGGGRTRADDDALLRFKRSMASELHPFRIGRRVHDEAAYARLKAAWEAENPQLAASMGGRLLCYRLRASV